MLNLGHFLEVLIPYETTGREPAVSCVVVDSREAEPGSLFVALVGEHVDGHDYVTEAFANGAVAAIVAHPVPGNHHTIDLRSGQPGPEITFQLPLCLVVDDPVWAMQAAAQAWRARFATRVIGITGSVGKSSTKELTASVLSQQYRTLKSPGNRNSVLGLPPVLLELRPFHQYAVLEMGMYTPGEIARLCEMAKPSVGVVTIIGPVHLERAGSMEAIIAAKQELVEALPADGTAVLNLDDDRVMSMAAHTQAHVFTYGLDPRADLWADNIRSMGLEGIRFTLHYGREALSVQVPLIGRHSVHTALRATAVGLIEGLSWDKIVSGLADSRSQLRLVAVPGPKGSTIIDDTYNSSPDSAMAALNLLHDLDGRRLAVLGDMLELGYMEEEGHRLVGRRAAAVAQVLVTVGARGRWIGEEALKVGMARDQVFMVDDVETAVSTLQEIIAPQDIILIKGSLGMKMSRIVAALGEG
ncbi:MAG: UDP-N-acetylmuramoyl-tripeptide--D-alanyl-D-alanine ligase [Ardenticatenaceae bacterium]|nr:UDP-N-acetylmuramoyl-tripeptide--D-alanyl-D-alanine ligase [Ardenticatenaceae bacterium]